MAEVVIEYEVRVPLDMAKEMSERVENGRYALQEVKEAWEAIEVSSRQPAEHTVDLEGEQEVVVPVVSGRCLNVVELLSMEKVNDASVPQRVASLWNTKGHPQVQYLTVAKRKGKSDLYTVVISHDNTVYLLRNRTGLCVRCLPTIESVQRSTDGWVSISSVHNGAVLFQPRDGDTPFSLFSPVEVKSLTITPAHALQNLPQNIPPLLVDDGLPTAMQPPGAPSADPYGFHQTAARSASPNPLTMPFLDLPSTTSASSSTTDFVQTTGAGGDRTRRQDASFAAVLPWKAGGETVRGLVIVTGTELQCHGKGPAPVSVPLAEVTVAQVARCIRVKAPAAVARLHGFPQALELTPHDESERDRLFSALTSAQEGPKHRRQSKNVTPVNPPSSTESGQSTSTTFSFTNAEHFAFQPNQRPARGFLSTPLQTRVAIKSTPAPDLRCPVDPVFPRGKRSPERTAPVFPGTPNRRWAGTGGADDFHMFCLPNAPVFGVPDPDGVEAHLGRSPGGDGFARLRRRNSSMVRSPPGAHAGAASDVFSRGKRAVSPRSPSPPRAFGNVAATLAKAEDRQREEVSTQEFLSYHAVVSQSMTSLQDAMQRQRARLRGAAERRRSPSPLSPPDTYEKRVRYSDGESPGDVSPAEWGGADLLSARGGAGGVEQREAEGREYVRDIEHSQRTMLLNEMSRDSREVTGVLKESLRETRRSCSTSARRSVSGREDQRGGARSKSRSPHGHTVTVTASCQPKKQRPAGRPASSSFSLKTRYGTSGTQPVLVCSPLNGGLGERAHRAGTAAAKYLLTAELRQHPGLEDVARTALLDGFLGAPPPFAQGAPAALRLVHTRGQRLRLSMHVVAACTEDARAFWTGVREQTYRTACDWDAHGPNLGAATASAGLHILTPLPAASEPFPYDLNPTLGASPEAAVLVSKLGEVGGGVARVYWADTVNPPWEVQRRWVAMVSDEHVWLVDSDGSVGQCAALKDVKEVTRTADDWMVLITSAGYDLIMRPLNEVDHLLHVLRTLSNAVILESKLDIEAFVDDPDGRPVNVLPSLTRNTSQMNRGCAEMAAVKVTVGCKTLEKDGTAAIETGTQAALDLIQSEPLACRPPFAAGLLRIAGEGFEGDAFVRGMEARAALSAAGTKPVELFWAGVQASAEAVLACPALLPLNPPPPLFAEVRLPPVFPPVHRLVRDLDGTVISPADDSVLRKITPPRPGAHAAIPPLNSPHRPPSHPPDIETCRSNDHPLHHLPHVESIPAGGEYTSPTKRFESASGEWKNVLSREVNFLRKQLASEVNRLSPINEESALAGRFGVRGDGKGAPEIADDRAELPLALTELSQLSHGPEGLVSYAKAAAALDDDDAAAVLDPLRCPEAGGQLLVKYAGSVVHLGAEKSAARVLVVGDTGLYVVQGGAGRPCRVRRCVDICRVEKVVIAREDRGVGFTGGGSLPIVVRFPSKADAKRVAHLIAVQAGCRIKEVGSVAEIVAPLYRGPVDSYDEIIPLPVVVRDPRSVRLPSRGIVVSAEKLSVIAESFSPVPSRIQEACGFPGGGQSLVSLASGEAVISTSDNPRDASFGVFLVTPTAVTVVPINQAPRSVPISAITHIIVSSDGWIGLTTGSRKNAGILFQADDPGGVINTVRKASEPTRLRVTEVAHLSNIGVSHLEAVIVPLTVLSAFPAAYTASPRTMETHTDYSASPVALTAGHPPPPGVLVPPPLTIATPAEYQSRRMAHAAQVRPGAPPPAFRAAGAGDFPESVDLRAGSLAKYFSLLAAAAEREAAQRGVDLAPASCWSSDDSSDGRGHRHRRAARHNKQRRLKKRPSDRAAKLLLFWVAEVDGAGGALSGDDRHGKYVAFLSDRHLFFADGAGRVTRCVALSAVCESFILHDGSIALTVNNQDPVAFRCKPPAQAATLCHLIDVLNAAAAPAGKAPHLPIRDWSPEVARHSTFHTSEPVGSLTLLLTQSGVAFDTRLPPLPDSPPPQHGLSNDQFVRHVSAELQHFDLLKHNPALAQSRGSPVPPADAFSSLCAASDTEKRAHRSPARAPSVVHPRRDPSSRGAHYDHPLPEDRRPPVGYHEAIGPAPPPSPPGGHSDAAYHPRHAFHAYKNERTSSPPPVSVASRFPSVAFPPASASPISSRPPLPVAPPQLDPRAALLVQLRSEVAILESGIKDQLSAVHDLASWATRMPEAEGCFDNAQAALLVDEAVLDVFNGYLRWHDCNNPHPQVFVRPKGLHVLPVLDPDSVQGDDARRLMGQLRGGDPGAVPLLHFAALVTVSEVEGMKGLGRKTAEQRLLAVGDRAVYTIALNGDVDRCLDLLTFTELIYGAPGTGLALRVPMQWDLVVRCRSLTDATRLRLVLRTLCCGVSEYVVSTDSLDDHVNNERPKGYALQLSSITKLTYVDSPFLFLQHPALRPKPSFSPPPISRTPPPVVTTAAISPHSRHYSPPPTRSEYTRPPVQPMMRRSVSPYSGGEEVPVFPSPKKSGGKAFKHSPTSAFESPIAYDQETGLPCTKHGNLPRSVRHMVPKEFNPIFYVGKVMKLSQPRTLDSSAEYPRTVSPARRDENGTSRALRLASPTAETIAGYHEEASINDDASGRTAVYIVLGRHALVLVSGESVLNRVGYAEIKRLHDDDGVMALVLERKKKQKVKRLLQWMVPGEAEGRELHGVLTALYRHATGGRALETRGTAVSEADDSSDAELARAEAMLEEAKQERQLAVSHRWGHLGPHSDGTVPRGAELSSPDAKSRPGTNSPVASGGKATRFSDSLQELTRNSPPRVSPLTLTAPLHTVYNPFISPATPYVPLYHPSNYPATVTHDLMSPATAHSLHADPVVPTVHLEPFAHPGPPAALESLPIPTKNQPVHPTHYEASGDDLRRHDLPLVSADALPPELAGFREILAKNGRTAVVHSVAPCVRIAAGRTDEPRVLLTSDRMVYQMANDTRVTRCIPIKDIAEVIFTGTGLLGLRVPDEFDLLVKMSPADAEDVVRVVQTLHPNRGADVLTVTRMGYGVRVESLEKVLRTARPPGWAPKKDSVLPLRYLGGAAALQGRRYVEKEAPTADSPRNSPRARGPSYARNHQSNHHNNQLQQQQQQQQEHGGRQNGRTQHTESNSRMAGVSGPYPGGGVEKFPNSLHGTPDQMARQGHGYYHAGAAHLPTLYDTPGSRKGGQTQPLSDTLSQTSSHDIIRFAPRSQRTPSDATAITVPPHTLPDYDRVPPDTNAKNVSPPLRPTVRRPTVTPAKPATPPPVSPELSCVRRSRSASPVPQQLAPARLLGSKQHREISPARHAAADPRSGSAAGATALSYHSDAVTVSGLTQAEIHKILF